MYRYKMLEWHGRLSPSPPQMPYMETGPATAGVNAGDRENGFNVTNDPDNIIDLRLVSMTNVAVPGLFIYRLDLGPSKALWSLHAWHRRMPFAWMCNYI